MARLVGYVGRVWITPYDVVRIVLGLVLLSAAVSNGEIGPRLPLQVIGRVVHDARIFPRTCFFGRVRVNTTVDETIALSSRTGNPFTVQVHGPQGAEVMPIATEAGLHHSLSSFSHAVAHRSASE